MVKLLLKANANPNAANHGGETPLHYASMRDDLQTVDLLLKGNANVHAATVVRWYCSHGSGLINFSFHFVMYGNEL
jgi:ankyrin repeat protein